MPLWTLLLLLAPPLISAYPDGAPPFACADLMPRHGMASAQQGQGLYSIMTEKTDKVRGTV